MDDETHVVDAYTPREIAEKVESLGVAKARTDGLTLLVLALLAGAFISLGALFGLGPWATAGGRVLQIAAAAAFAHSAWPRIVGREG